MLTQSQNDHEALVAIRKANQLLACLNLNWEQFLGVARKLDEDPKKEASDASIDKMFEAVKSRLQEQGSDALSFIEDIEVFYIKTGKLTPKQLSALKKFYAHTF